MSQNVRLKCHLFLHYCHDFVLGCIDFLISVLMQMPLSFISEAREKRRQKQNGQNPVHYIEHSRKTILKGILKGKVWPLFHGHVFFS